LEIPTDSVMPRNARCVLEGTPYHVTQRGTDRQRVFFLNSDREMYLRLLSRNLKRARARLLAYSLMTNHIHAIVIPERADSLALLFRRVHGRYAQYVNTRRGRSGHLWQGRFYSCPLEGAHLATALRYVEENPCRVGLAERAQDYRWSSAAVHCGIRGDEYDVLDLNFWERAGGRATWEEMYGAGISEEEFERLRQCTYGGRPFGSDEFVTRMEETFGRSWRRGSKEQVVAKSA
jgi:putative transposase